MNERTDTSCLLQAFLHLSEGFIGVADPSAGHAPPEYVPDRVMVILENAEHLPTCRLQELEGKAGRHMIVPQPTLPWVFPSRNMPGKRPRAGSRAGVWRRRARSFSPT